MVNKRCLYAIYALGFVALITTIVVTVTLGRYKPPAMEKITRQGNLKLYPNILTLDQQESEEYRKAVANMLQGYNYQSPYSVLCMDGVRPPGNHSCIFDLSVLGECSNPSSAYGFLRGSPCLYLSLSETGTWIPKDDKSATDDQIQIRTKCIATYITSGSAFTRHVEAPVKPLQGFPPHFFPEGLLGYQPPLAAIQLDSLWEKLSDDGCVEVRCIIGGGNAYLLANRIATIRLSTRNGLRCDEQGHPIAETEILGSTLPPDEREEHEQLVTTEGHTHDNTTDSEMEKLTTDFSSSVTTAGDGIEQGSSTTESLTTVTDVDNTTESEMEKLTTDFSSSVTTTGDGIEQGSSTTESLTTVTDVDKSMDQDFFTDKSTLPADNTTPVQNNNLEITTQLYGNETASTEQTEDSQTLDVTVPFETSQSTTEQSSSTPASGEVGSESSSTSEEWESTTATTTSSEDDISITTTVIPFFEIA